MKKASGLMIFFLLLTCIILFDNSIVFGQVQKIKAGYFTMEPHIINKGNSESPIGATIDLWLNYLSKEMNVEVELIGPLPMLRLQQMLDEGKIDVVIHFAKTEERAKKYLYPKTAYTFIHSGIAVLKDSSIKKVKTPSDLYGKKIGYFSGGYISPFMTDKKLEFVKATSTDWVAINYRKLLAKKIDVLYEADFMALKYQFKTLGKYDLFNYIELPEEGTPIYSVFSKKNNDLMKKYEAALLKVYTKISYQQLIDKYIK